jgi:hypothetical protein
VHVVERPVERPPQDDDRSLTARMARDVINDSIWLQRHSGFGFRFPATGGPVALAHTQGGEYPCDVCGLGLDILRAPLAR